ncbi:hypothetical protein [Alteraurantiacibacter aquimixticola]|uniref:Tetratricopeptide repeat protein n=1 Tax=Alteraurantiacibacter aquimixticola TaxID=2489173 RepID=A0A4T3F9E5_9SPHN|nr:hypothetical protein [Alteraurantiacibacter aquimixticola]TIX51640.1 hypothetical protein E5222_04085 [Alteraurantiacibacter aquimixticola]
MRTGLSEAGKVTLSDAPFEGVDFGPLPPQVHALLQEGVRAHRHDNAAADACFRAALEQDPAALPAYLCLYKIHTYGGRLAEARAAALAGLAEACRQAGWPADWRDWPPLSGSAEGPGRFALYTLKALAFIALKDGRERDARAMLERLAELDPQGLVGWQVIGELAAGASA